MNDQAAAAAAAAAAVAPPIGQLFVEQGHVTPEQLDDALFEQRETGERLGEILVARGHISRIELASAIGDQWHWQPPEDETRLPQPSPEAEPLVALPQPEAQLVPEPIPAANPLSVPLPRLVSASGPPAQFPATDHRTVALEATAARLVERVEELAREVETLRNASITHQAQLAAAARALVS